MQHITIPTKRAELLEDKAFLKNACKRLGCSIKIENGNELTLEGDPLNEYEARLVIQAFARGFDFDVACKLLQEDTFFESRDLKAVFKKEAQITRIKARIIGREGKAKNYIQEVSGVDLVIYGDTVSVIGKVDDIKTALAAIDILIEGGTHNAAYTVMEKTRRRLGG